MSATQTVVLESVAPGVWIARAWAPGKAYPQPYNFVATVVSSDRYSATVKGALGEVSRAGYAAFLRQCHEVGLKDVFFERRDDSGALRATIERTTK